MKILVAYATRHGATRGIAERIAQTLQREGLDPTLLRADEVTDVWPYDAFVIGSAAYLTHWLKPAADLVRRHRAHLADHPVWLFSSGPIGTDMVDTKGRDVLITSRPREFAEFWPTIHPRDERIFFGAFDPDAGPIGLVERLGSPFMRMSAVRSSMPAGDYRDWAAVEAWAEGIAQALQPRSTATAS